jgi:hypothetical protein
MRISALRHGNLYRPRRLMLGQRGEKEERAENDDDDDRDCDPGHGFRLRKSEETGLLASLKAAV